MRLQLGRANASGAGAAFWDMHLSVSDNTVSIKICDKRDDFNFEAVNFPFLHADVLRSASCWGFAS